MTKRKKQNKQTNQKKKKKQSRKTKSNTNCARVLCIRFFFVFFVCFFPLETPESQICILPRKKTKKKKQTTNKKKQQQKKTKTKQIAPEWVVFIFFNIVLICFGFDLFCWFVFLSFCFF